MTDWSLSRGDAPRPTVAPSPEWVGALRVGVRGGGGSGDGGGSRGQGRRGTVPPRVGSHWRAGAVFQTPRDRVEGGIGARCGVVRGGGVGHRPLCGGGCLHGSRGVSRDVRARVCAWRGVGWHRGGCLRTGSGWCGGAWPWGQESTSVTRPCPPGGGLGAGGQRGGSGAEVLQTHVLCGQRGGRQQLGQQRGKPAWVGRPDLPPPRGGPCRAGLG